MVRNMSPWSFRPSTRRGPRAVANLYGTLDDDAHDGIARLLNQRTIRLFAAEHGRATDAADGIEKRWGQGFQLREPVHADALDSWGPHDEAFGFNGGGGQVALADPASGVGACFVRSRHSWKSAVGGRLVDAFYACLQEIRPLELQFGQASLGVTVFGELAGMTGFPM
ncbi:serine hydrolase [Amycolatopsis pithecellobii]|uniref:Serine hydrolase n=1 Tax=Amycolatopsis pithecellobii TaxID=664692 RepID=A0A6N7Z333_9PSEU|nr:serine hydrolase [Amycolatopsis pithecellobii]